MAEAILTEFKQQIKGLELEPSGGGCFEVSVDGDSVYSKLETGEFPESFDIVRAIKDLS